MSRAWTGVVYNQSAAPSNTLIATHGIDDLLMAPEHVYAPTGSAQTQSQSHDGVGVNTFEQTGLVREVWEERLEQDEKAWEESVDKFLRGEKGEQEITRIMDVPPALQLPGIPAMEIKTGRSFFTHTLQGEHADQLDSALLKKLVRLLADPIMVFDSRKYPGTAFVAMLDLIDSQGATVLVPVHLRVKNGVVTSVRLTSFYGKGEAETGTPRDEWFINEVVDEETGQLTGRLRYINTKKYPDGVASEGSNCPKLLLHRDYLAV